jgi:hypothetical protein
MTSYNIDKQKKKELYSAIENIITKFTKGGVSEKDLKKYFKKEKNLRTLIKDLRWLNHQVFNSDIEYTNYVRDLLKEVIEDFLAAEKDKNKKEKMEKTKTFEEFFVKGEKLYEIALPIMKIDEILQGVTPIQHDTAQKVIAAHYGTYTEYIDVVDKKRHHFKVNDMKGDVLNSNRVTFDVVCFYNSEMQQVRNNIINFAVSEFYMNIPEFLDIFGISLKPNSFINKEELKATFEGSIPIEHVIEIITNLLGYKYEGIKNDHYIWEKK